MLLLLLAVLIKIRSRFDSSIVPWIYGCVCALVFEFKKKC